MTTAGLPAWAEAFAAEHRTELARSVPLDTIDRAWAFGAGDGAGVTVAVIDSGVEGSHPAIGGALVESVRIELDGDATSVVADEGVDAVGHGTACAGIIHALAPAAELVSVRVLGADNRGKGLAFAAGLEEGYGVVAAAGISELAFRRGGSSVRVTLPKRFLVNEPGRAET